ncbi:MAG: DNA alkylation repair protein [Cyclobacteriaceae bacterium]|nr:DNA alkylation repair protein [Cyclobacteriaceae bacterium]
MDKNYYKDQTLQILALHDKVDKQASALQSLWEGGERKSTEYVKKEDRDKIKNLGVAVDILKTMGQVAGKKGKSDTVKYIRLAELLWEGYGREGRVVASHILGQLNDMAPEMVLSVCRSLVATSVSWEECDNLTYGVEPIIRKYPAENLEKLNDWLTDDSKWVKRVALNVLARLPMKQADYTTRCMEMASLCFEYDDHDVRRTCSFVLRMAARGNIAEVPQFLERNIGGQNKTKVWIFSDTIKSMTKSFLPEFKPLLPLYEKWKESLTDKMAIKSIDSAIKLLK